MEKHTLAKEISCILVVKLAAIYLIWSLCFSHLTPEQLHAPSLEQHFLSSQSQEIN